MSIYTDHTTSNWKEPQKKQKKPRSKWKYEDTTPVPLCKGVEIDSSVYEMSENRYFTLILKGIIVYLLTAGGIGAYLTAMEIEFNQIAFNVVILITAVICAILYHSWKSENLGYLVFFAIYAAGMVLFKDYVNSGFYAVINDTIDWASIYFDTEGLEYYNERITNRYVAITISMIMIGIAENVLLNNYILRRARFMVAIALSLTVNIAAFYMEMEPATIYTVMVMFGIIMTFVLKAGGHFLLSRRDHIFGRSKKGLSYNLDFKSLWQGMATVLVYVLIVVAVMSTVYNKTTYDGLREKSEDKEASRETFQNIIMLGVFGIIDYYPNNGGLATGELGGVSNIRLDHQPDISIIFTPYSAQMTYVKGFTGGEYLPYENRWLSVDQEQEFKTTYGYEVEALKDAFEDGSDTSAQGFMTITNIEAPAMAYQPYYSEGDTKPVFMKNSKTYTYYPRLNGNVAEVEKHTLDPIYLQVPDENKEVVDNFIDEIGLKDGSPTEVAQQLKDYYQENIPYTIRPGATPWRKDFVNHFLEENRKGYCAHFASAATLIFREMGIPARYCEGYAVSLNEINDTADLVEDASYADRYSGFNELGETAVIRIDASDADAHAWVEVYDEKLGWLRVEVTPSATGDEVDEQDTSFWDNFNGIFGDGDEDMADRDVTDGGGLSMERADAAMRYIAFGVIGVILLIALGFLGFKFYPTIKYRIDYSRAGLSDKLVLKYSHFIKKKSKKDKKLSIRMNYAEQLEYLMPTSERDREKMLDIMERAGFSRNEISESEFKFANEIIENWKVK